MYSVSSLLSDCSPGGSFGTGSGLEVEDINITKKFMPNLINIKVAFKIHIRRNKQSSYSDSA